MSASLDTFYSRGSALMTEAIAADAAGDAHAAFMRYRDAAAVFVEIGRLEKDATIARTVYAKLEEVLQRCDLLKATLAQPPSVAVSIGVGDAATPATAAGSEWFIKEKPNVAMDEVVGLEDAKRVITESFHFPRKNPSLYHGRREPWSALLMYGPPGTGKTMFCKAVATELDAAFLAVKVSDITSKFFGDSEKRVKELFEQARLLCDRPDARVVIFIDELDALCGDRSDAGGGGGGGGAGSVNARIVSQILQEMDGIDSQNRGLFVMAATNLPWAIDAAVLRRFPRRLFIGLPSEEARFEILKRGLGHNSHILTDADFRELAAQSAGLSASDLKTLVNDVLMLPVADVLNATEFVRLPGSNKYVPVLTTADRDEFQRRFADNINLVFVKTRWNVLEHDTIDPSLPVTKAHVADVMRRATRTASPALVERYTQWASEAETIKKA